MLGTTVRRCAAVAALFASVLTVDTSRAAPDTGQPAVVAPSVPATPPPATEGGPSAATNGVDVVELRGGPLTARVGYRTRASRGTARATDVQSRWVGPLLRTRMTSCYGPRWGRTHEGVDYDGETGDVIRSVGPGVVVQAGWRYSGLGNSVVVDHGRWLTIYGHASRVTAHVGQRVRGGTPIARVGATGHVTGSHLHLALSNGGDLGSVWDTLVNPAPWLRDHRVPVGDCR